ncbi:MAG: dihydrolipoyl dehydrogenase [Christensenellaceae bacterium]|nr:dihydrolipoyl dehydrogenase [Christensenellaceae bacterium]
MIYDLIVIGGGPGGYNACEKAAAGGLKVLLFEQRNVGGVCLNEGCIPTKTFLYSAKLADGANHGAKYGVYANGVTVKHEEVVARKDKVVKQLTGGIRAALKGHGVEIVEATAHIEKKSAEGYNVSAAGKTYTAKRLLIAAGSEAIVPPIPGVKEQYAAGFCMTNREILDMKEVPEKLVVIGGGVIGLEMASYFNSVGSKVTVVEMLNKIGGPIDSEISKLLQKNYEKKGVTFNLGCRVTAVEPGKVVFEKDGKTESVAADKVLLSIGRRAASKDLGLENLNIAMDRAAVITDEHMQTNMPGVYACGDINGKSMLAHTAYREGEVAVNNMLGIRDKMHYNAIPGVIYTNPEVGTVGETEETAKAKGIDYVAKTITMRYAGRYVAENEGGDGILKIIVDKKWNKLIGVHMITNYASEIIYGCCTMIEKGITIDEIKKVVFPHPTVCEAIREAIFML